MGIDRLGPTGPLRIVSGNGARPGPAPDGRDGRTVGDGARDQIELSSEARRLAAVSPEERAQLVRELSEGVRDGSYRPDADAVARRMVDRGDV